MEHLGPFNMCIIYVVINEILYIVYLIKGTINNINPVLPRGGGRRAPLGFSGIIFYRNELSKILWHIPQPSNLGFFDRLHMTVGLLHTWIQVENQRYPLSSRSRITVIS